jgi:hypothetical protein
MVNRKTFLFALLSLLLPVAVSALPLATGLAVGFGDAVYPSDVNIGPLAPPGLDEVASMTAEALSEPWGPEWVDRYVAEKNRLAFSVSFNDLLARLLPLDRFSLSVPRTEENGVVVVARSGGSDPVYLTVSWEREDGMPKIVAVSISGDAFV